MPNELKFIDEIDLDTGWEIETDTGFKPISKIYKTHPNVQQKLPHQS